MKRKLVIVLSCIAVGCIVLGIVGTAQLLRYQRERWNENSCCGNLMAIDAGKESWAIDSGATDGQIIADTNAVLQFMKNHGMPVCPSGGTYCLQPVGEEPSCSVHGSRPHVHDHNLKE